MRFITGLLLVAGLITAFAGQPVAIAHAQDQSAASAEALLDAAARQCAGIGSLSA